MVEFLVQAILELAGSPKDFIDKTMGLLLEKLEKDDELELKGRRRFPIEEHDGVFSTFAEIEVGFKEFDELVRFCFAYMPSHLELIKPQRAELRREELAELLNELMMNLHKMDQIVKDTKARHKLVEDANKMLIKNSLAMALKDKPLTPAEISTETGIKQPNLQAILDFYEDKGLLKKKGKKYMLAK